MSLNSTFGIYQIRQISTGRIYIGSTSRNFYDRFSKHKSDLNNKKHSSIFLQRCWNQSTESDFSFEVLEILTDKEHCWARELELVQACDPCFNVSKTIGPTRLGHIQSEETREAISKSLTGLTRSDQFKQNLSKSRQGASNPAYGKSQSEETKLKRAQKLYKKVIRSDGTVYDSLNHAAIENNCTYQNISQAIRKNMKASGYKWSYHER